MDAMNYTTARKELARTMERVCEDCEPVIITKSRSCAVVMMSLEDYNSLVETEYLLSDPVNAERLRESLAATKAGNTVSMSAGELEAFMNEKI